MKTLTMILLAGLVAGITSSQTPTAFQLQWRASCEQAAAQWPDAAKVNSSLTLEAQRLQKIMQQTNRDWLLRPDAAYQLYAQAARNLTAMGFTVPTRATVVPAPAPTSPAAEIKAKLDALARQLEQQRILDEMRRANEQIDRDLQALRDRNK